MAKMKYDCKVKGCYINTSAEVITNYDAALAEGWGRSKANFGDFDAVAIGLDGAMLVLEIKRGNEEIAKGQHIGFEKLTGRFREAVIVFVIWTDNNNQATHYLTYRNGERSEKKLTTDGEVKQLITDWGKCSEEKRKA